MSKSSITTTDPTKRRRAAGEGAANDDLLPNPHPGEILLLDFLAPMGLSQNALARAIDVPPRRINELVHGKRAVTADTDLRLARYFGVSEGFFLGLQADYELMRRRREIAGKLAEITPRAA
jgi:addiction module HigA family antidote